MPRRLWHIAIRLLTGSFVDGKQGSDTIIAMPAPDARTKELVAQASQLILQVASDPKEDARLERAKASFNVDELAAYMAGGKDALERRARLTQLLESQPWGDKSQRYFLNREQEYVGGLQAGVGIW